MHTELAQNEILIHKLQKSLRGGAETHLCWVLLEVAPQHGDVSIGCGSHHC